MEANTKQFRKRNAILSCVQDTHCHPSAETVHAMLQKEHPDISLATVYRNLDLFKRLGLITSVGTVKGVERFDENTDPHVHFVCNGCDAVLDLPEMQVPKELCHQAELGSSGHVTNCQLIFTGTCQTCTNNNQ